MISRDRAPAAQLGHYQIGQALGQGGMGTVYRARDRRTGGDCAVKLLHPWRTSPQHLIRFKREFRAAARLDHPHCLRVFELDSSDGQWFYAMEYAAGGPFLPEACATWQDAAVMALQVLAALDHIHAKRIIHRDIKPQNILLDGPRPGPGRPQVRLADFGISKVFETEERALGEVLGTLGYLAPEQLDGQADPRSDLFSLGMVLYETIGRRHPLADAFQALAASDGPIHPLAWRSTRARPIAPLAELAPAVPSGLTALVMRLLEPQPQDRYPTAATVFEALERLLAASGADARSLAIPPLRGGGYLAAPSFVGRASELARLDGLLEGIEERSGSGRPFTCLVEGEAGTGKSRLMAELVSRAHHRGAEVATGVWRAEAGGPWALRVLLELAAPAGEPAGSGAEAGDAAGAGGTTAGADGGWPATMTGTTWGPVPGAAAAAPWSAPATAALGQSTLGERPDPAGDVLAASEGGRWAVYRRVADGLIARSRARSLVFVFEDAHWADPASLELLGFVIRSVGQARLSWPAPRIAFVFTFRPLDEESKRALADLQPHGSGPPGLALRLQPLGLAEAVQLVCSILTCAPDAPIESFVRRIYQHTEGNPLYLGQTLHLLLAEGKLVREGVSWRFDLAAGESASLPRNLRDAIGDRAARLSVETKWMLAAAAVIGPRCEFDRLHLVSQIEAALLLDCLDEALRADFIVEDAELPGSYRFIHERVRDAIGERLAAADRQELHRRTLRAIEAVHGDAPEAAEDLAFHARGTGELGKAQAAYQRAAEFAWSGYAFARAADFYGRALEIFALQSQGQEAPPPLLAKHANACLEAGRYDQALAGYQRLLTSTQLPLARAELLGKLAEVQFRRGNTAEAGRQMEEVLRILGFGVPRSRLACYKRSLLGSARAALRVRWGSLAPAPGPALSAEQRALTSISLRCSEFFYFSDLWRALSYTIDGFTMALDHGGPREVVSALSQQAYLFSVFGMHRLSQRLLDEAERRARSEDPVARAWNRLLHGMSLGSAGRAHDYAQALREGERLLLTSYEPMKLRQIWTLLGEALLAEGDLRGADQCGQQVLRIAEELNDDRGRGWAHYVRGWASARLGDLDQARTTLTQAVRFADQGGDPTFRLCASGRLAYCLLLRGELARGLEVAEASAREFAARGLRHPSVANDGIFLAAAALVRQQAGELPRSTRLALAARRLLGRELAHSLRLSAPLYWAGRGAYAVATGDLGDGRAMIARGLKLASDGQLWGEALDLHALAARILPGREAALHQEREQELRARLTGPGR